MELYMTGMVNKMIKDFSVKDIEFIFKKTSNVIYKNVDSHNTTTASVSFSAPKVEIKNQIFYATIDNIHLKSGKIPETFADAKVYLKFVVKKAEESIPTAAKEYLADLIIPSDQITLKKNDQYYALPVTKML